MGVADGGLPGTGLRRSHQPHVSRWLCRAECGFPTAVATWALLPGPLVYSWPGPVILKDILMSVQGLVLLWPLPHFQSRGCASFSSLCMRCFRLLCKLAGIMAQLGSQLKDFPPIKRKYCVF